MPVSLSDDELAIVMDAAQPLEPQARGKFLHDVAAELAKYPELGPGSVHRLVRATQRKYFDPPQGLSLTNSAPRSRRVVR